MLSTGQLIFAALFFIGFIVLTIISYKKDKTVHQKQFKGSKWILIGLLLFILLLFILKKVLDF
jgi:Ca2+/Na+ antiporter